MMFPVPNPEIYWFMPFEQFLRISRSSCKVQITMVQEHTRGKVVSISTSCNITNSSLFFVFISKGWGSAKKKDEKVEEEEHY